jgi:subfamily B ATP-binding cassette protein HlyB/CyaB
VLGILRTYVFSHTTNRIDVELGARLFRHLLALPIAYFQARRVGDSVARVRELENIRNFLTSSALTLVIDLFFTFVFLAVMFVYSPLLTWIVIASLPLYVAISAGATPLFRARLDEKFKRGAENQAFLVECVAGAETLKAMAVEPQMQRRWEEQIAGYVAASFRVTSLGNTTSQIVQLINKLVVAGILYFGARLVIDGDLTVGELVAFNLLAGRVSAPVLRLAQIWQDFHQARLSVQRLGDILNTPAEPVYSSGRTSLPAIRGDITFEHVTFRYRADGAEVLHDISLTVPAGQQHDPGKHRAGRSRPAGRACRGCGEACRRSRLHPRIARRLRHDRGRAWQQPVRWPAAAHRDRSRVDRRPAHPDLRRGDERARLRERADRAAEHALCATPCRSHHHRRARPPGRGRDA